MKQTSLHLIGINIYLIGTYIAHIQLGITDFVGNHIVNLWSECVFLLLQSGTYMQHVRVACTCACGWVDVWVGVQ